MVEWSSFNITYVSPLAKLGVCVTSFSSFDKGILYSAHGFIHYGKMCPDLCMKLTFDLKVKFREFFKLLHVCATTSYTITRQCGCIIVWKLRLQCFWHVGICMIAFVQLNRFLLYFGTLNFWLRLVLIFGFFIKVDIDFGWSSTNSFFMKMFFLHFNISDLFSH